MLDGELCAAVLVALSVDPNLDVGLLSHRQNHRGSGSGSNEHRKQRVHEAQLQWDVLPSESHELVLSYAPLF